MLHEAKPNVDKYWNTILLYHPERAKLEDGPIFKTLDIPRQGGNWSLRISETMQALWESNKEAVDRQ